MADAKAGRCVNCRSDIDVPDSYASGDRVPCGTCGTAHKLLRSGETVRLVLADLTAVREELRTNQAVVARLTSELAGARASFGLGVNGFGIGFIYVLVQVAWEEHPLDATLIWTAVAITVGVGVLLEAANALFLAKRHQITRLNQEIAEARTEGLKIQQKLRDAARN